jgi:hypothetical protein
MSHKKSTLPGIKIMAEQLRFATIPIHPIRKNFDGGGLSSDLGPVLLQRVDRHVGLTERLNPALVCTHHVS